MQVCIRTFILSHIFWSVDRTLSATWKTSEPPMPSFQQDPDLLIICINNLWNKNKSQALGLQKGFRYLFAMLLLHISQPSGLELLIVFFSLNLMHQSAYYLPVYHDMQKGYSILWLENGGISWLLTFKIARKPGYIQVYKASLMDLGQGIPPLCYCCW